jgi:hypothetical protein
MYVHIIFEILLQYFSYVNEPSESLLDSYTLHDLTSEYNKFIYISWLIQFTQVSCSWPSFVSLTRLEAWGATKVAVCDVQLEYREGCSRPRAGVSNWQWWTCDPACSGLLFVWMWWPSVHLTIWWRAIWVRIDLTSTLHHDRRKVKRKTKHILLVNISVFIMVILWALFLKTTMPASDSSVKCPVGWPQQKWAEFWEAKEIHPIQHELESLAGSVQTTLQFGELPSKSSDSHQLICIKRFKKSAVGASNLLPKLSPQLQVRFRLSFTCNSDWF